MLVTQDGILDTRKLFHQGDTDYMVNVMAAEWELLASGQLESFCHLKLQSGTLKFCSLGDFVVFCISHMALRAGGRILALGLFVIGSFAKWLSMDLHRRTNFCTTDKRPKLTYDCFLMMSTGTISY